MITLEQKYTISPSVLLQVVDDEVLLFDSSNGQFFTINDIGAGIWEVMQDYSTLDNVLQELKSYFDIPREKLSSDVLAFADSLVKQGIILIDD